MHFFIFSKGDIDPRFQNNVDFAAQFCCPRSSSSVPSLEVSQDHYLVCLVGRRRQLVGGGGFISGEGFPPTPTRRSSEKLWTKVPRKRPQQYSLREAIRTLEVLAVEGRALGKVFRWTPPTSKVWADATPGVSFAPPVACFLDEHCF